MQEINQAIIGMRMMYLIEVIAMIIVIIAIGMDLAFGWRKAKLRGDARTSYAFSRTITKFALYEGVMLIACGIDTLIHFVWSMFNNTIYSVPLASSLIAIVLCIVEIWSMKEKADEKTRNNLHNAIKIVTEALPRDQVIDILKTMITETRNGDESNE